MIVTPSIKNPLEKFDEPKRHMDKVLQEHLVTFDLSLRILIPLERAGIRTLGDLAKQTPKTLKKINGLGKLSIETLRWFMIGCGLRLA